MGPGDAVEQGGTEEFRVRRPSRAFSIVYAKSKRAEEEEEEEN